MVLAKVCKWVNTCSINSENQKWRQKDVVKCGAAMGRGSCSHLCEERVSRRYLRVQENFYWCFLLCSGSLQNPVILANALLWKISHFPEEINWPTLLSNFLNVLFASLLNTMLESLWHNSYTTTFLLVAFLSLWPMPLLKKVINLSQKYP